MTLIIERNQVGNTFETEVENFIQELLDYRFTVNVARPTASPLVELAVQRVPGGALNGMDDYVADYQIIESAES